MKDNIKLLNQKNETLKQEKCQIENDINLKDKKVAVLQAIVKEREMAYHIIANSWSFRLGKMISSPIRLIRKINKT